MVDNEAILQLQARIGSEHLSKRLQRQTEHSALRFTPRGLEIHWENIEKLGTTLKVLLKACGLFGRATRNSMDYKVETVKVPLRGLPPSFRGFRILHLSDLHLESILDRGRRLREVIGSLHYDLCVITGDFRFHTYGDYEEAIARMAELTTAIHCPHGILGILGNHDFIEMVPGLEKHGLQMLLNESVPIHRGKYTMWIVGLDDTNYYGTDDLAKALRHVPAEATKILLAHSPEIIESACEAGMDYYLCGHSHGGQMCLPGGISIINNSHCGRQYIAGPWNYQNRMPGYTSRGTGASLLPVRIFCPPEITLHHLV